MTLSATTPRQAELELLERAIGRLGDTVMITAAGNEGVADQRIVYVNEAFERRTGYSRAEVLGLTPSILQGPQTQGAQLDRIRLAVAAQRPVSAELIHYRKDGTKFWTHLELVPLPGPNGDITHYVSAGRNIAQRKAAEAALGHLAFVDPLTQLPNRLAFMQRLEGALTACSRNEDSGALLFIDVDNFKQLNDTLGHDRGDELLRGIAARLAAVVRGRHTVARLGGDEFVVLLKGLGANARRAPARATALAGRILAALRAPYVLAGHEHHSTASVGVTCFSGPNVRVGEVLKQADLAMYQAKARGRNAVCLFEPAMQAAAIAAAALTSELRSSLRDGDFVLHYQPQVMGGNARMSGVEALVRWQHPLRGMLMPDEFIPVAEDSGLIVPLGHWVLQAACAQLAVWAHQPVTAHLSVAVNVSVRQFQAPDFIDLVLAAVREAGVRPDRLKLELTETLFAEGMEITIAKMGKLREIGVTLALDDFGMGYSSLSALKRMPLNQLKIDKGFVRGLLSNPSDAAIARAIISMADSLDLGVLAEGVETEGQREFLAQAGCHCYQGYLFSRPLPIAELEEFMGRSGRPVPT